jgi:hypothetical protein
MEAVMRIRRTILAPVILATGTVGALIAAPVAAFVTPAAAVTLHFTVYHASAGTVAPDMTTYHS